MNMDYKRHSSCKFPGNESRFHQGGGDIKVIPFRELQDATDDFSEENILGKGSFGTVYRGQLPEGSLVAIKRIPKEEHTLEGEFGFLRQIEVLGKVFHPNLLPLYGFCSRPQERFLVYPYMSIGNLASRLKSQPPLSWPTRRRIVRGVASALAYLHHSCHPKIIHHRLKATNVLLDEDFNAIVGDFGLFELVDQKDFQEDGDRLTGSCPEKTDVYDYGLLILELVTGLRIHEISERLKGENISISDWARGFLKDKKLHSLVDSDLRGKYVYHEVEDFICVALQCMREYPSMSEVVKMLEDPDYWSKMKPTVEFSLTQEGSFSFSELKAATNNFNQRNILGKKGLLGSTVYKGKLAGGSEVAVKRIEQCSQEQKLLYQTEVLVMRNITPHQNLLQLSGFCISENELFLVYPLMVNGNLSSSLSKPSLTWPKKKKIALGVAKGLAHLHDHCRFRVIHGDLKAEHILLDKNFTAVIGGFSGAQLAPNENEIHFLNSSSQSGLGTPGYVAPERLLTKKATTMADVFAYGVILLELITGDPAVKADQQPQANGDNNNNEGNDDDVPLVNRVRRYKKRGLEVSANSKDKVEEEVEELVKVGLMCTQGSPAERPTMSEVVRILEGDDGKIAGKWQWEKILQELVYPNSGQIQKAGDSRLHPSDTGAIYGLNTVKPNPIAYRWHGSEQRWEPIYLEKTDTDQ